MTGDIIAQVRLGINERNNVIKFLYQDQVTKRAVIGTLVKMGCPRDQAMDHFTDAIVSFVKACYRPDFVIKSSITNYLIGTAKNIWLKGVTKSKREVTITDQPLIDQEESIETLLIADERKELLRQVMNRLDDTCQQVLALWSYNKRMKEIASKLQYKSEGMARKKKHQCMQRLYATIVCNYRRKPINYK